MDTPKSFIKDIGIEINPNFLLTNTPMAIKRRDPADESFIGRDHQRAKFLKFLHDGKKGIFMVTGERGIGKTSFVNHVLSSYKHPKKNVSVTSPEATPAPEIKKERQENHNEEEDSNAHIIPISLTLSQSLPKEIDILWLMVNSVYDQYATYLNNRENKKDSVEVVNNSLLMKDNWLALFTALIIGIFWASWPSIEFLSADNFKYLAHVFSDLNSWVFLLVMMIPLLISIFKLITNRDKAPKKEKKSPRTDFTGESEKSMLLKLKRPRLKAWFYISLAVFFTGLIGRICLFPRSWPDKKQEGESLYSLNWIYYSLLLIPISIFAYNLFKIWNTDREQTEKAKRKQVLKEFDLKKKIHRLKVWLFASISVGLVPLFIIWKSHEAWQVSFDKANQIIHAESSIHFVKTWVVYLSYAVLFICFVFVMVNIWRYFSYKRNELKLQEEDDNPYQRIKRLRDRCIASMMIEDDGAEEIRFEGFPASLLSGKGKKVKQYPVASNKEIEYELQSFLKLVGEEKNSFHEEIMEFIFVFDELDKVEPIPTSTYLYEDIERYQKVENATSIDFRERKQAIINIIAGLKNFFTTAYSRFIFIAGHEMFDASLADIADRQSSLSSIFTYTFNIESFLREKYFNGKNSNASLSKAIENYLKWVFFYPHPNQSKKEIVGKTPDDYKKLDFFSLLDQRIKVETDSPQESISTPGDTNTAANDLKNEVTIYSVNNSLSKQDLNLARMKLKMMLQKFIDFITYRSNGSPKKIIKGIHDFITIFTNADLVKPGENDVDKKLLFTLLGNDHITQRQFLYFNYNNQCRIGFLSYLYRPFLIQYGRSYKLYSDNIISSTSYLFDHLLKFHSFAFSMSHLELVPEILSTSKTPSLQSHLNNIIEYLRGSHIRRTEVGLFDYKFYSKTLNEITYISKLFEEESAAFNFTLDESYMIKIYLMRKIKELRNNYSKANGNTSGGIQQIYSISHLNGRLGDLHFFDQQYDDAIVAYSDAIRPINNQDMNGLGMRDFVTLIKNKLKLGLCFEKINSFEEALSFYADSCQDAKRYIMHKVKNNAEIDDCQPPYNERDIYPSSSLNDLLQIVNQCFLATIIVEEKMGIEGISGGKLGISLGNFLQLSKNVANKCNTSSNNLAIANAYLLAGKLFYFKNTPADLNTIHLSGEAKDNYRKIEQATMLEDCKDRLNKLSDKFDEKKTKSAGPGEAVKRKPTLALHLYILGLCETMRSKNVMRDSYLFNKIIDPKSKNISAAIIKEFEQYLTRNDERLTGIHYRYIASFLSSIGDVLYALCRVDEKKNKVTLQYIFNPAPQHNTPSEEKDKTKNSFFDLLKESVPASNEVCLQDVLKCYYLSAKFFNKYGRGHSEAYQYRKILRLLKTVLDDESDMNKDTSEILKSLEEIIVTPLLMMISKNYGHSERHMIKKGEALTVDAHSNKPFILNNISNHPETREVVLLYSYIWVKLGGSRDETQIDHLVSPYNSVATQYGRFSELEFYAKYLSRKIEKEYVVKEEGKKVNIREIKEGEETEIYKNLLCEYLYTMLTMVRLQKIYANDYTYGYHKLSYHHYNLAHFLELHDVADKKDIAERLSNIMEDNSYTALDWVFHAQVAKDDYQKVIELHTAGNEYKKMIGEMLYLKDDFNDNAYHFGAAESRYLIANAGFEKKLEKIDLQKNDPYYKVESYTSDNYGINLNDLESGTV